MRLRDAKQALLLAVVGGSVDQVLVHLFVELERGFFLRDVLLFYLRRADPSFAGLLLRLMPAGAVRKVRVLDRFAQPEATQLRSERCLRERALAHGAV